MVKKARAVRACEEVIEKRIRSELGWLDDWQFPPLGGAWLTANHPPTTPSALPGHNGVKSITLCSATLQLNQWNPDAEY